MKYTNEEMLSNIKNSVNFSYNQVLSMVRGEIPVLCLDLYVFDLIRVNFPEVTREIDCSINKKKIKIDLHTSDSTDIINFIDFLVADLNKPKPKEKEVIKAEKKRVSILEV